MIGIAILYIGVVLIAILQAMEDVWQYHHSSSIFRNAKPYSYWGKNSWVRKWAFGNPDLGEKFFGSSTFLVWLTDGWHLIKWLQLIITVFTIIFAEPINIVYDLNWWYFVVEMVIILGLYGVVFEVFYKFIFRKR